jgi:hypothetical protein
MPPSRDSKKGKTKKTNLESVKLHIGVTVVESLDHALDSLLGAILVPRHLIAYFDDGAPVLRRQILVSRLGCDDVSSHKRRRKKTGKIKENISQLPSVILM